MLVLHQFECGEDRHTGVEVAGELFGETTQQCTWHGTLGESLQGELFGLFECFVVYFLCTEFLFCLFDAAGGQGAFDRFPVWV